MDFERLFELPDYQAQRYPQKQALSGICDGNWFSLSTSEVQGQARLLAVGMYALGLRSGQMVGILSSHGTPYWNLADLAMMRIGVVPVPIHATSKPETIAHILRDCGAVGCWVSDPTMLHLLEQASSAVKYVFRFPSQTWTPREGAYDLDEILRQGRIASPDLQTEVQAVTDRIKPTQLATLIYTSGTSGEPKGVMLSHHNLLSNVKSTLAIIPLGPQHHVLSFLPLSHVFERMVTYTYLAAGASVWYADQADNLPRILRKVRPHFFTAVPRVVERVYARVQARRDNVWPPFRKVFDWALQLGMQYPSRGGLRFDLWKRLQFFIADVLVFAHIRRGLGGRVKGIIVGAAALDQSLARLFTSAGMPIREGYGLTETSPVVAFNRFEPGGNRFGTVGMAVPGVEIRINQPNADGDGEIEVRGPNVMLGYFNRPKETSEKITSDGWLRTGDQGRWVDRHFLKITGRLSELFKTTSGKFVSPTKLETRLVSSAYISQAMALGLNRPYVGALIVPDFEALERWARAHKVHWTAPQYMLHNQKIEQLLRAEIDQINAHLEPSERIRTYALLFESWTSQNGLLTPTLKHRRAVIAERFAEEIVQMYARKPLQGASELSEEAH